MADPVVRVLDFEGPLHLLIHLIEKNKMDIYDIPIVSITDQYIEYLHSLTELDLEEGSQFLVMASLLLQIKSRMLLPKTEMEDEEEADPREMLVQMLVEYRRIKEVSKQLEAMKREAARQHTRKPFFANSCRATSTSNCLVFEMDMIFFLPFVIMLHTLNVVCKIILFI